MRYRVGIDIGGTFTDGVMIDTSGAVYVEKLLSTPHDLSDGFLEVVDSFARNHGVSVPSIQEILHASTVATNALLEHKGARVGLLVTAGFRDILEIGRQVRHELYNLFTTKPPPLVARRFVFEIDERVDYRGHVVRELRAGDVVAAGAQLRDLGIESVAICFLHSYRNPEHEQRAATIIGSVHPTATVSVSSELAAEIKEYWRASTTCVNAYVAPVVSDYLDRTVERLTQRGFGGLLWMMHSGGGVEGLDAVKLRPFQLIESGPAAGVAAASRFAQASGYDNALTFDMGGTTAKAGIVVGGVGRVLTQYEVAGSSGRSGSSVIKASGYPVLGEVVDLVEVGAGGGSIAWVDEGGHLRVGPRGAGAKPGPACYQQGGALPTITDADLVLGRLNPDYFLGGKMPLRSSMCSGRNHESLW